MKRKPSEQILTELEAADDGVPTRPIGTWTLEKLAILLLYFHAFTSASEKARGGVYVDGLAGHGLCEVRRAKSPPKFVWGSPLIAARTDPPFDKCVFIEANEPVSSMLRNRTRHYAERCTVVEGDVNLILPKIMLEEVHRLAPCLCLLDPEGTELAWETVRSTALTPGRRRKPELLILFPSRWLLRLLPTKGQVSAAHEQILDRMMPGPEWREVYGRRLNGAIAPSEAKDEYVELYRSALENLGYKAFSHAVEAPSVAGGRRTERYQLIFATEHPAGEKIMSYVFKRPYVLDFPVSLQRPLFET